MIKLGPGNDAAAEEALAAWPGGLQIGGGITIENAKSWLDKGAAKVCAILATSACTRNNNFVWHNVTTLQIFD